MNNNNNKNLRDYEHNWPMKYCKWHTHYIKLNVTRVDFPFSRTFQARLYIPKWLLVLTMTLTNRTILFSFLSLSRHFTSSDFLALNKRQNTWNDPINEFLKWNSFLHFDCDVWVCDQKVDFFYIFTLKCLWRWKINRK